MCEQFFSAVEKYFIPITKPFGIERMERSGTFGMGYCYVRLGNTHLFIFDISLDHGNAVLISGARETHRPVNIGYLLPDKDGLFGNRWLYQFSQKESQAMMPHFVEWQVKRLAELLKPHLPMILAQLLDFDKL